jgi:hypothetical protein
MAIETPDSFRPLGPRDAGAPMTLAEFDAADFQLGYRYELIHGMLVVTPPPLEEERDANEQPLLPGFELHIAELLAISDRYEQFEEE